MVINVDVRFGSFLRENFRSVDEMSSSVSSRLGIISTRVK
jgi:hypothetical protein